MLHRLFRWFCRYCAAKNHYENKTSRLRGAPRLSTVLKWVDRLSHCDSFDSNFKKHSPRQWYSMFSKTKQDICFVFLKRSKLKIIHNTVPRLQARGRGQGDRHPQRVRLRPSHPQRRVGQALHQKLKRKNRRWLSLMDNLQIICSPIHIVCIFQIQPMLY